MRLKALLLPFVSNMRRTRFHRSAECLGQSASQQSRNSALSKEKTRTSGAHTFRFAPADNFQIAISEIVHRQNSKVRDGDKAFINKACRLDDHQEAFEVGFIDEAHHAIAQAPKRSFSDFLFVTARLKVAT